MFDVVKSNNQTKEYVHTCTYVLFVFVFFLQTLMNVPPALPCAMIVPTVLTLMVATSAHVLWDTVETDSPVKVSYEYQHSNPWEVGT